MQVVVVGDESEASAANLLAIAGSAFSFTKSVLRLAANQVVAENLPPALAATLPNLPELKSGKSFAVLCSGFSCQPPITNPDQLRRALESELRKPS